MAASSLSWMARLLRVWAACVMGLASFKEDSVKAGSNSPTIMIFMCGTADVATASSVGSLGDTSTEDGVT